MLRPLATRARAKVNLTLHVLGRRDDGYHDLESLVAFAALGDVVCLRPQEELMLTIDGPTAAAAGPPSDNLVLKAARALLAERPSLKVGAFHVRKLLPVGAGLGGGSSDAAAALRLLARHNGLALDDPAVLEAARSTGADVPVCLVPRARMMRGIGHELGPPLELPPLFAVLAHPGVPAPTRTVFAALGLAPGQRLAGTAHPVLKEGLSAETMFAELKAARNDLEGAACQTVPQVIEALSALGRLPKARLVRMSGSGSTVFALFGKADAARAAAGLLSRAKPHWWVRAARLR